MPVWALGPYRHRQLDVVVDNHSILDLCLAFDVVNQHSCSYSDQAVGGATYTQDRKVEKNFGVGVQVRVERVKPGMPCINTNYHYYMLYVTVCMCL